MATPGTGGQDIAVRKALEAFRKDLMPILTLDMKAYLVKEVKEDLGKQLREELRKEMRSLSSKVAEDMSANSESVQKALEAQVKKLEESSKAIQSSSMKALKAPVKTKALRKSVAAAAVQNQRAGFRKLAAQAAQEPLSSRMNSVDGPSSSEERSDELFIQNLLTIDPRKVEVVMGEERREHMQHVPILETEEQVAIDNVLNHWAFDVCMAAVILLGAFMMGVSLQYGVYAYLDIYDVVTAVLFSVELLARFYCYRWDFFLMNGYEWNVFDLFIVTGQLISLLGQTGSTASGFKSLRGLRGLRALRSLRLLRTLRLLRFVEEFRSVVSSMLASLKATIGVLLLFTFGLYLFGAVITNEVLERKWELGEDRVNPEMLHYFGTLTSSMLSLYESVTGGLAWSVTLSVFMDEGHYMMATAYVFFIAACVFVLLNVLTAIFTGHALLALQEDQDAMIVRDIDLLFQKGELYTGDINWQEFQSMLDMKEMVHLFRALNIDVSEARQLFRLLDTDNVGVVDYNEFIHGCLRLRGPAKSLELVLLMKDSSMMNAWTTKKLNMLSAEVQSVQFSLSVVSQQLQALAPAAEEEAFNDTTPVE
eukprot:TRINITY_DN10245_c0_g1_i1.p1 TRINITY_DN10245_c0_g1~~TRINITY_DN10245_c0_g1_i1.p1  ORF type:complete len:593 (+),score=164.89 TRINITY_DN10245_c0_g1_i1:204-1982(+)